MKTVASFVVVSSLAFLGTACSVAPSESEEAFDEEVAQTEDALTACGPAKYNEALVHYKNAVAWSKDREANGVCQSAHGLQWEIANEASRAVMTCGTFRTVIRTSPWAAPLRRVLGNSLTLRSLSGELAVIKDSQYQNWTGVEAFFNTEAGLSFWARAQGAYGPAVRVDLKAGGKGTWGYLHHNPATGDITWRTEPATYTVTKIDGTQRGKRRVTVVHGGKTEVFTLGVEAGWEYRDAPVFVLQPTGAATKAPKLYSLVSECDA